tara:strand:+ start:493 stop:630 length:138 start_codon:yes stop_codon:yes gene_type:complete
MNKNKKIIKMQVTEADKKLNTPAWRRYMQGDTRYEYKYLKGYKNA